MSGTLVKIRSVLLFKHILGGTPTILIFPPRKTFLFLRALFQSVLRILHIGLSVEWHADWMIL